MSVLSGVNDKCYSDNLVHTFNCRLLLKELQNNRKYLGFLSPKKLLGRIRSKPTLFCEP